MIVYCSGEGYIVWIIISVEMLNTISQRTALVISAFSFPSKAFIVFSENCLGILKWWIQSEFLIKKTTTNNHVIIIISNLQMKMPDNMQKRQNPLLPINFIHTIMWTLRYEISGLAGAFYLLHRESGFVRFCISEGPIKIRKTYNRRYLWGYNTSRWTWTGRYLEKKKY